MTRGAAALALITLVVLVLAAPASAGSFRVSQCNAVDQGGLSARPIQAELWWTANGWPISTCGTPGGTLRFDTANHRLPDDGDMTAEFALPAWMPLTTMRTAWLDWQSRPQSQSTNPAYLFATASYARLFEANSGDGT